MSACLCVCCRGGYGRYRRRSSLIVAMNQLQNAILDGRVIRLEVDKGYYPGRELGRGATGKQVRWPPVAGLCAL
jgi:nuclear cap-binding protein subunit 2